MKLKEFISSDWIVPHLGEPAGKSELFEVLLTQFAQEFGDAARTNAVEALQRRESQGTTGIGNGVALPHATVVAPGFSRTRIYLGVSPEGIDFQALDDQPVNVVFLIISSEDDVKRHIGILARIARLFTSPEFIGKLCKSTEAEEIYRLIVEEDRKHL